VSEYKGWQAWCANEQIACVGVEEGPDRAGVRRWGRRRRRI